MTSKVTPEVTEVGPKIRLEMPLFPLSGAAPKIKKNHRRPKISWSGPKEVGKPVGGPYRAFRCPIMPHIGRFLYIPIKKGPFRHVTLVIYRPRFRLSINAAASADILPTVRFCSQKHVAHAGPWAAPGPKTSQA